MKFKRKRFKRNEAFYKWLEKLKNNILLYDVSIKNNKINILYELKGGLNGKNGI